VFYNHFSRYTEFETNQTGEGRHLGNGGSAFATPPRAAKTTTRKMLEATMGTFENWRYSIVKTEEEQTYSRMARILHIHKYNSGGTSF
jgi:hypothetical protein